MASSDTPSPKKVYIRFDLLQRFQHLVFLLSFTILGFTGLPQKFPLSPISIGIFEALGGIENVRLIHHIAAVVMLIVSLIHVLEVLYRILVLRSPISMIPWINDAQHVLDDVLYYLGRRKHKAYYGRYSYAEKMEYLALVWGTVIMTVTGFMMWNPLTTANLLPGEAIPAAKAAHGAEAILAVLAIMLWHFYHVHVRHFNKSMFTGKMSREEMEHEHPAELAAIDTGKQPEPIPPAVLRKRQIIYAPIALVILAAFGAGVYFLTSYERTAVTTALQGETAQVFVPITPTPTIAPTAAPTTDSGGATGGALTWNETIGPMLAAKCGACHGADSFTGLSLDTYANTIKGGKAGPVIVPSDSAGSKIVQVQQAGGHPGMLSPEELNQLIEWINAGAPEQ